MFEINDEFQVIEKEGVTGLTFGAHVVPFGFKFTLKDWPYNEAMLEAAIMDDRVIQLNKEKLKKDFKKPDNQK